jgi:hypothetical protein
MKDDRLRVQLESAYAEAIGRAVFIFARLEWDAVWICEKLNPGYINNLGTKTAGLIANDLIRLTIALPNGTEFAPHCVEFKRLVDIRNKLLHGKPGTAVNGDQNLFDRGVPWTIKKINDAADEFSTAQIALNPLMHSLP